MKRRTVFTATAAAISAGALAGCLGGQGDTGNGGGSSGGGSNTTGTTGTTSPGTSNASATATNGASTSGTTGETTTTTGGETTNGTTATGQLSIADKHLESTGECSNPESATIQSSGDESSVTVTGCIRGPNGCSRPKLESVVLDGDTLRVVVTTKEQKTTGNGTACTQVIVHRGYRVTVDLSGGRPKHVEVVHDTMGERKTVATSG